MTEPHIQAPPAAPRATKVIAVANQKGGVGKTTTTINLAACLAELKKTILVVDMDPQCNATSGFGLPKVPDVSIYKALLGEGEIADLIQATPYEGVNIIPAELDLAGAEIDIVGMDNYLHRLSLIIQPIVKAGVFDYILLDCPPSLGILTMNGLAAAHSLLIPIQCEYYALEGLTVIAHLVDRLKENGANTSLVLEGIVMTMYDGRTNLADQVVNEVRNHFGDKVFKTMIPRNIRLSEAPSFGKPIIYYDRASTGAHAYQKLAAEFLKRQIAPPAPAPA